MQKPNITMEMIKLNLNSKKQDCCINDTVIYNGLHGLKSLKSPNALKSLKSSNKLNIIEPFEGIYKSNSRKIFFILLLLVALIYMLK